MSKTPFSLSKSLQELEEIERYFQQPDLDLELAIAKHKQALELAKSITEYLNTIESTLETLSKNSGESAVEE